MKLVNDCNATWFTLLTLTFFALKTKLYAKLVSGRQELASLRDIPPAILATNKILLDIAKTRYSMHHRDLLYTRVACTSD